MDVVLKCMSGIVAGALFLADQRHPVALPCLCALLDYCPVPLAMILRQSTSFLGFAEYFWGRGGVLGHGLTVVESILCIL
jgi:hypothetical protein